MGLPCLASFLQFHSFLSSVPPLPYSSSTPSLLQFHPFLAPVNMHITGCGPAYQLTSYI